MKSGTGIGWVRVKLSLGSGPAITDSTMAASDTERTIALKAKIIKMTQLVGYRYDCIAQNSNLSSIFTKYFTFLVPTSCPRGQSHCRLDTDQVVITPRTSDTPIRL